MLRILKEVIGILSMAYSGGEFLRGSLLRENNSSSNSADLTEMEMYAKTGASFNRSNVDWAPLAMMSVKL